MTFQKMHLFGNIVGHAIFERALNLELTLIAWLVEGYKGDGQHDSYGNHHIKRCFQQSFITTEPFAWIYKKKLIS